MELPLPEQSFSHWLGRRHSPHKGRASLKASPTQDLVEHLYASHLALGSLVVGNHLHLQLALTEPHLLQQLPSLYHLHISSIAHVDGDHQMLGAQLLGDGEMFPGLGNVPICGPTHKDGSVRYVVGLDTGESVFRKTYSFF